LILFDGKKILLRSFDSSVIILKIIGSKWVFNLYSGNSSQPEATICGIRKHMWEKLLNLNEDIAVNKSGNGWIVFCYDEYVYTIPGEIINSITEEV